MVLRRCCVYKVPSILSMAANYDLERVQLRGTPGTVNMSSLRLRMFATKGCKCVTCGIEGAFFATEVSAGSKDQSHHLNLYAVDPEGHEILMTKDHIVPSSKGGKDELNNLQPMCCFCNSRKGNKVEKKPDHPLQEFIPLSYKCDECGGSGDAKTKDRHGEYDKCHKCNGLGVIKSQEVA